MSSTKYVDGTSSVTHQELNNILTIKLFGNKQYAEGLGSESTVGATDSGILWGVRLLHGGGIREYDERTELEKCRVRASDTRAY